MMARKEVDGSSVIIPTVSKKTTNKLNIELVQTVSCFLIQGSKTLDLQICKNKNVLGDLDIDLDPVYRQLHADI